mgnify:CR=1 FL=1
MRSSNIGGQAVMEGIMMRHKDKYSIAVRRPDQEIELKVEDYKCIFGNHAFLKKPIIRGVVSFVDSLVVGTKCLMYSAEIAGDEEDEETARKNEQLTEEERSAKKAKEDKQFKWLLYITVAISMVVSVAAFMFLPYVLASLIRGRCFGISGHHSGSLCEAGTVYGIYVPDLQNEGYPEDIYVSRCGAQMYQLCGAWSASDGRECVKEFQVS